MAWRSSCVLAALVLLQLVAPPPRPACADPAPDPDRVAAVVANVQGAVVRVIAVRPPKQAEAPPAAGVAQAAAPDHTTTAIGSGFLIAPSGFVATNKHVVADAVSVFVATVDGVRYKADVVGATAKSDMALLKIDAGRTPLPSVPFGESDKMRVGDTVIAIGSPFGFDNTVTTGVVSAVNRDIMESPFDDYIQTDAPINHGNSGGPLFNLQGEVIGMNSVLFAPGDETGSVGVGFAIPSNDLRFAFERLMATGQVKAGMLPIRTQQVTWMVQQAIDTPDLQGALVADLIADGDKMMQGQVKPGDVILAFNGQKVIDPRDLARKAAKTEVGSDAALLIWRDGAQRTVHVAVQSWPESQSVLAATAPFQNHLGLGLAAEPRDGQAPLVTVASVDPTGTAADSGIQKGDVILQVQETPVSDAEQATRLLWVQSFNHHRYAIVLVERGKKHNWIPLAVPQ